jgi:hypothetical protein
MLAADRPHRIGLAAGALAFATDRSWQRELDRLIPMYRGAIGEVPVTTVLESAAVA